VAKGYILNEGDAKRLREMDNEVSDLTSGRLVGRRNRRTRGGGDTYNGQFKVTDNGDNTVDIAAGKVINGTTVTNVPLEEDLDVENMLFISLEVWYNAGWFVDYLAEATYPTQAKKTIAMVDYWAVRFLIASRAATTDSWKRQICGEIHNTRAVKA
jgi:hypothetical protein